MEQRKKGEERLTIQNSTKSEQGGSVKVVDGKKLCSTCKINKPLSDFGISKKSKSGRRSQCKKCEHEYRVLTKERSSKYHREYGILNREKISEYQREYRKNNKNKIDEYNQTHKEERKKYFREYREKNIDRIKARDANYYQEHKEETREQRSKYRSTDSGKSVNSKGCKKYDKTPKGKISRSRRNSKRRGKNLKVLNNLTLRQWNKILKMQNNKCAICGREFGENLKPTRDHIIPLTNPSCPGLTFGNTQSLCQPCNTRKSNKFSLGKSLDEIFTLEI